MQKSNSKILVEWNRANCEIDKLTYLRETIKQNDTLIRQLENSLTAANSQIEHMSMMTDHLIISHDTDRESEIANLRCKMQEKAKEFEDQRLNFNCIQYELDAKNIRIAQVETELERTIREITCLKGTNQRIFDDYQDKLTSFNAC